jgi:tetratricopeptide (TPR) repeat protein
MAVSSWRHVPLFAFFSISLWAVALQAAGEAIFRHAAAIKPSPAMRNILLSAAALVFLGNSVVRLADPDLGSQSLEKKLFPCWTAQFLMANNLSPHLFHPYGWGGYLIWKIWPRYKVFIDGRAIDTYPAEVYRDYLRVSTGQAGAFDILNRRGISLALTFLPGGPEATSRIFEGNPQWRLIYEDDLSRVFIRTEELGARKLTYPANPHNLAGRAREAFTRGDFGAARAALERALGLDNRYAPAYLMLGAMELSRGDGPKGVSLTKRALELDPLIESAHYNLALYALRRDDRVLAMEELRKELGNNEGNTEARKLLLKLEAKR